MRASKSERSRVSAKEGKSARSTSECVGAPREEGGGCLRRPVDAAGPKDRNEEITYGLQHIEEPCGVLFSIGVEWRGRRYESRSAERRKTANLRKTPPSLDILRSYGSLTSYSPAARPDAQGPHIAIYYRHKPRVDIHAFMTVAK